MSSKHHSSALVDGNLLRRVPRTIPKRFVTRAEFGRRFGIGKRTLSHVLAAKRLPTITINTAKQKHTLIDLQQMHEVPSAPGKIFDQPTAAAAIGITVKALHMLRDLAILKSSTLLSAMDIMSSTQSGSWTDYWP